MFFLPPKASPLPPCVTMEKIFTTDELDRLEEIAASAADDGVVVSNPLEQKTTLAPAARRSKIKWLDFEVANQWIYERIAGIAGNINVSHYRFDLTGLFEKLQMTRYESSNQGHYDWHQDYGTPISRKLSLTLQLTEPDHYDGGVLQILTSNKVLDAHKERGLVVVFPAYQLHRVTPVERGARHSLVAWVSGPPFR